MCLTLDRALLSATKLYAGEAKLDDKYVHVIGYQNQAENMSPGPNAMILPFPSQVPMGPANVVDTSSVPGCLNAIAEALPKTRSRSFGPDGFKGLDLDEVEVFETGPYTVVMSQNARAIPGALGQVPEKKRPAVNAEIFDAYAQWYPNWPIALCCFEAGQVTQEAPMLWWYEPLNPEWLFIPGLDGHDGHVPNLDQTVKVLASVAFGSTLHPVGGKVRYEKSLKTMSPALQAVLPTQVIGNTLSQDLVQGDYLLPVSQMRKGRSQFVRMAPPGATPTA